MSSLINTKFILGEAGTAKSTTILGLIENLTDFVCLAFTHSAVNNLKNKCSHEEKKHRFRTIHSFFKIKFNSDGREIYQINTNIKIPKYIFIDEISLVPIYLMDLVYKTIESNIILLNKNVNLVLVGDLLQLNPIAVTKNLIDYTKLFTIQDKFMNFQEAMLIADHLSNNIFSTKYYQNSNKMILTQNYRNGTNIINILNEILKNIKTVEKYMVSISKIQDLLDEGYIILSSRYDLLKTIYEVTNYKDTKQFSIKTKIGEVFFNENEELILTKNINKNYVNGDIITLQKRDDSYIFNNDLIISRNDLNNSTYPVLPKNFLTIHKSQGLTLDKVIIVLDDLFEITMLYTAITRAKSDVKFILLNDYKIDSLYKKMQLYSDAFIKLKDILYN